MQKLWPIEDIELSANEIETCREKVKEPFQEICSEEKIKDDLTPYLTTFYIPFADWIRRKKLLKRETIIVGINGAQGSGKSTLSSFLTCILEKGFGLNTVILSIDDIYKTRQQRLHLAQNIHPLFETRGVPGTHDSQLGIQLLSRFQRLNAGQLMSYPSFDKANGDRTAKDDWPSCQGPVDVVLFEGWCVGARAQEPSALKKAVNSLEIEEDTTGIWRNEVNKQLSTDYKNLFSMMDCLIFLKIPSFDAILKWRGLQEQKLISGNQQASHSIASTKALKRFIQHFERLTRHQLGDLPKIADVVVKIDHNHQAEDVLLKRR